MSANGIRWPSKPRSHVRQQSSGRRRAGSLVDGHGVLKSVEASDVGSKCLLLWANSLRLDGIFARGQEKQTAPAVGAVSCLVEDMASPERHKLRRDYMRHVDRFAGRYYNSLGSVQAVSSQLWTCFERGLASQKKMESPNLSVCKPYRQGCRVL